MIRRTYPRLQWGRVEVPRPPFGKDSSHVAAHASRGRLWSDRGPGHFHSRQIALGEHSGTQQDFLAPTCLLRRTSHIQCPGAVARAAQLAAAMATPRKRGRRPAERTVAQKAVADATAALIFLYCFCAVNQVSPQTRYSPTANACGPLPCRLPPPLTPRPPPRLPRSPLARSWQSGRRHTRA